MCKKYEHEYATWNCGLCGHEMCFSCAVCVQDESQGNGMARCPNCGMAEPYGEVQQVTQLILQSTGKGVSPVRFKAFDFSQEDYFENHHGINGVWIHSGNYNTRGEAEDFHFYLIPSIDDRRDSAVYSLPDDAVIISESGDMTRYYITTLERLNKGSRPFASAVRDGDVFIVD